MAEDLQTEGAKGEPDVDASPEARVTDPDPIREDVAMEVASGVDTIHEERSREPPSGDIIGENDTAEDVRDTPVLVSTVPTIHPRPYTIGPRN